MSHGGISKNGPPPSSNLQVGTCLNNRLANVREIAVFSVSPCPVVIKQHVHVVPICEITRFAQSRAEK